MVKIAEDISTLTTIPKTAIDDLFNTEQIAIGHCVYESLCSGEQVTSVDIGLGTLHIKVDSDDIRLKLEPSKRFSEMLQMCYDKEVDPLTLRIDESLKDRINKKYKELM